MAGLRRTPLRRSRPAKKKQPNYTGPSDETKLLVCARANFRCERCNTDVSGGGAEIHHRRPRGMGGTRAADTNDLANLLLLCLACHRWVESNRAAARESFFLVRQGVDPSTVPVLNEKSDAVCVEGIGSCGLFNEEDS